MSAWPLCSPVKVRRIFRRCGRLLLVAAVASVCPGCRLFPRLAIFSEPAAAQTPALAEEAEPRPLMGPPRPPRDPVVDPLPVPPEEEPTEPALPWEFAAAQPGLIARPVPVFPDSADFDEIIGGFARFRVWIDEEGAVRRVELLEASAEVIVDPVRVALLDSRYTPVITPDGHPVRVSFIETVSF